MSDDSGFENDNSPLRIPAPVSRLRIDNSQSDPIFEDAAADADFDFWCRMATWTIDEAVSLSLRKDPETVNWESLQPFLETQFGEQYRRIRMLALRAASAGRLNNPCVPSEFVAWAADWEIVISGELVAAVFGFQKRCSVRHQKSQNPTLVSATDESENQKSFNMAVKIIGALSVAIYKFDPAKKKSDVPAEMASDLALIGFEASTKTIRKYVHLGVDMLGLL